MDDNLILWIVSSYLIGCFNTGYYYVRIRFKKDIRTIGSFSTGATNVSRLDSKRGFIITFLGDSLKSLLTMLVARHAGLSYTQSLVCLFALVAGHIFPLQLGFRGGKGVSPLGGGLTAIEPLLVAFLFSNFLVANFFIKDFQTSGLISIVLLLFEFWIISQDIHAFFVFLAIVSLIVFSHRKNITKRLKRKK